MGIATMGSLFSGIGGLDFGLERAGLGPVVWQVETDEFCRRVLARHWPKADRSITDVRLANAKNLAPVDLICGGFPCQDLSVAGDGAGLAGDRSGLWYDFARIVGALLPRLVIIENVAHGRGRWLPFVRHDLETLGYRTRAHVVAASDVGAPHERRRCFVIADANGQQVRERPERVPARRPRGVRRSAQGELVDTSPPWRPAGASTWTAPPEVPGVDDGLPDWLDRERSLGNAVVPQVGEVIGRIVVAMLTGGTEP